MPKPRPDETLKKFIARFMSDAAMIEKYPKSTQRYAVAMSYWRERHKGSTK